VTQAVGAVAGWAALALLAVLSVLYVSHARDVRRLREWAGHAPERSRPVRRPAVTIRPRVAVALAGALVLGGAITYGVTSGDDHPGKARASHKPKRKAPAVKPGQVTVAVLNGTTVPGLAAMLRDRIAAAGFKKGTINNFSDQGLAESVVQYAPGQQAAAKAVSRTFGITQRERVDATSRALAPDATVIVIAGADKAP
jgi:hypothetical protein